MGHKSRHLTKLFNETSIINGNTQKWMYVEIVLMSPCLNEQNEVIMGKDIFLNESYISFLVMKHIYNGAYIMYTLNVTGRLLRQNMDYI